jgi:Fe-S-cluster containining protein
MLSLTDALCTECGLCCDGSLFSDVELSGAKEISGLEALGVNIEDGDLSAAALLLQPCSALQSRRCSIYAHRPKCCRTFECRLLKDVQRGAMSCENARQTIAAVTRELRTFRELLGPNHSDLPLKEQYLEVIDSIAERKKATELMRRMRILEETIKNTFLE